MIDSELERRLREITHHDIAVAAHYLSRTHWAFPGSDVSDWYEAENALRWEQDSKQDQRGPDASSA